MASMATKLKVKEEARLCLRFKDKEVFNTHQLRLEQLCFLGQPHKVAAKS